MPSTYSGDGDPALGTTGIQDTLGNTYVLDIAMSVCYKRLDAKRSKGDRGRQQKRRLIVWLDYGPFPSLRDHMEQAAVGLHNPVVILKRHVLYTLASHKKGECQFIILLASSYHRTEQRQ